MGHKKVPSIAGCPLNGVTYLPFPESAFPNNGMKLGIKSIMFSLPALLVLQVSFLM